MPKSDHARRAAGRALVEGADAVRIRGLETALAQERETNALLGEELLSERIAELEFALEDVGYQRLTMETRREFSRWGLGIIAQLCRIFYLKNPLVRRAAEVQRFYVFGQGMTASAREPAVNAVVQAFMDDRDNAKALTGHQARGLREIQLQTDGQFYVTLFANPAKGRLRVRVVPVDEITEIIAHPEDRETNLYYRRQWQTESYGADGAPVASQLHTAYYPDWRFPVGVKRAEKIGDIPVLATPMLQVKVGALADMRFGVPELYPSIDWARAVKSDLEDYATIKRALARFAMTFTTKGGPRGIAQAKAKMATTINVAEGDSSIESNPPPVTGATAYMPEGSRLEPFRSAGAQQSPEDSRRLWLMVSAAVGIPETILAGNADVGNLATAKTLDRPTELKFRDRQMLWSGILHDLLEHAVLLAARAPGGPDDLRAIATVVTDEDGHEKVEVVGEDGVAREPQIEITFPPLLEHDPVAAVQAVIEAATLRGLPLANGFPPRTAFAMLFQALGVPEADELLDRMFPDDENALEPYKPAAPMPTIDSSSSWGLQPKGKPHEMAPQPDEQRPGDGEVNEALRALWRELSPVIERRRRRASRNGQLAKL